jgi:hypothetical protein
VLFSAEAVAIRMAVGLMNLVRQLLEPILQQYQEQGSLVVVDRQRVHLLSLSIRHAASKSGGHNCSRASWALERMFVCALLSLKLRGENIFLMAYMPILPAFQTTPLFAAAIVTDLEPDSVWGGVRIFDELLHGCLFWHKSDYRTFPEPGVAGT